MHRMFCRCIVLFSLLVAGLMVNEPARGEELSYSNTQANLFFPPGAGRRIADDLFLDNTCRCDVNRYEFKVTGNGDGTGDPFTVTYGLYQGCPNDGGVLVPGSAGEVTVADDGEHIIVHSMTEDNTEIEPPVWLAMEFDRNGAGWITGVEPELGFSSNVYDFPSFPCDAKFSGDLYASFWAQLYCEDISAPLVESPSPANGASGQSVFDTILQWNEFGTTIAAVDGSTGETEEANYITPETFVDGTLHPDEAYQVWLDGIANGEVEDPSNKILPEPAQVDWPNGIAGFTVPQVTPSDIFPYPDSSNILSNGFTTSQLFALMANASNAVISTHGDHFDFIGFWLNFDPISQIGAAFYQPIRNDVTGLGINTFENSMGVTGDTVQGWVMMWDEGDWSINGSFTYLVLGQEFEHRFGMYLDPMAGGRALQGNNGSCGRSGHWNFRVDGQGSGMEIPNWVGANPATRSGGILQYNQDIQGSVFSYPDLYLMGYVSGEEMDANASELRYMDDNLNCSSSYNGQISTFTSASIVGTNGARTPTSFFAQKHFKTAWIMFHRPNQPPTGSQLNRVVQILNNWNDVYVTSTLGRGTMQNVLSPVIQPEPCSAIYDVVMDVDLPPTTVVCESINTPLCDPGDLEEESTYYWQVTAEQSELTTLGPIWSFSTSCNVESTAPETCTLDSRQPADPITGVAQGWDSVTFTFQCETAGVFAEDFEVNVEFGPAPSVIGVTLDGNDAIVELSSPIPTNQWTCITHTTTGEEVCLGLLPGDVDGSRQATTDDILLYTIILGGAFDPPLTTTDFDRNGALEPDDLLRLIDILNGGQNLNVGLNAAIGNCPSN